MPFFVVRNDITRMKVDAIVNAANSSLLGGGGVDGAIHEAAGPELLEECRTLNGCATGCSKVTKGYRLPAKYIIHTVGPIYQDGRHGEAEALKACYDSSLELALEIQCKSIAFPLISGGIYGYPKQEALAIAETSIRSFLVDHEMDVYLVLFDPEALEIEKKSLKDIQEYIDDHYVDEKIAVYGIRSNLPMGSCHCFSSERIESADEGLGERLKNLDAGFSDTLLQWIDAKGMKDTDCYHKANISRKLFSKIRSNASYKPSKPTALAFAIALELDLDETNELLKRAGYALSESSMSDVIVSYFIEQKEYDLDAINHVLFHYDQPLLGQPL